MGLLPFRFLANQKDLAYSENEAKMPFELLILWPSRLEAGARRNNIGHRDLLGGVHAAIRPEFYWQPAKKITGFFILSAIA